MQNLWILDVIDKVSIAMGINVDVSKPNDVAEFLMPSSDIPDESKICLYNVLEYLTSKERMMLGNSIALSMPYFLEHANMNNVFRALARLEVHYKGCSDPQIISRLEHDKYEKMDMRFRSNINERKGFAPEVTTLLGLPIETFYNDEDNAVVLCLKELYNNEELKRQPEFGGISFPFGASNNYSKDNKKELK